MALLPEVQQFLNEKTDPARKRFAGQVFRLAAFVAVASILGTVLWPGITAVAPKAWSAFQALPDLVRSAGLAFDKQWRSWGWQAWGGAGVLVAIWFHYMGLGIAPLARFHDSNYHIPRKDSEAWAKEKVKQVQTVVAYWLNAGAMGLTSFAVSNCVTGGGYCASLVISLVGAFFGTGLLAAAATGLFCSLYDADLTQGRKAVHRRPFIE